MNSSKLLIVVVGLQVLTLGGQWLGQPGMLPQAAAQVPDAGAQRLQMIDELKSTNAKLDRLIGILESGNLQVKTVVGDGKAH